MNKIDYQALRAKAEKATCGEWSLEYGEERFDAGDALIHREVVGYLPICRIEGAHPESGFDEDFQMEQQANAEFIAAANPATVLALLDELEAAEKRIAELESLTVPQLPQQAVPDEMPEPDTARMFFTDAVVAIAKVQGWNACSAAMLHSAEPVSQAYKLNALDGNSQVTPDGWISCSERMPDKLIPVMVMYEDGEMWSAMWNGNRWDDGTEYPDPHSVTHWREMPAAPKQEVKS
ncbi:ead/Ea22-like family protein [Escherichia coli]|uniref:ead/Ea22-like family protein n=1 Tax=Escherichia coli TaxID=562 RepID=UPI001917E0B8|nr:ead/Ea22-like family protein [Escherichia coli]CAD6030907.1 putative EA22-like protein [Escherichia coli]CAD6509724.1 putative EA22-like protein [Escherichia coli]